MNGGIWVLLAAVISFGVTALIGKWMVPFLHKINFGQTIRDVGPKWHQKKSGTPTMGGFMFMAGILAAALVCLPFAIVEFFPGGTRGDPAFDPLMAKAAGGLLMALGFGAIGFLDDYIKVVKKRNLGLNVRQKLFLQFLVAGAYLFCLYITGAGSTTLIPFIGGVDLGIFYWILALLGIVYIVNAVNFTDGIDGLCGCVTFVAALCFLGVSAITGAALVGVLSAALAGGCLGFLLWNFNPAKVFMGDTGSLFLGGMVCALAFALNLPILILPVGIIYIIEILSVMIQVTYFKLTHGKRVFKMTPIHHHFEMCGWGEMKICAIFSLITLICGVGAFLSVLYGF